MRTPIRDELGCEPPVFAFLHDRDVVVEVTLQAARRLTAIMGPGT